MSMRASVIGAVAVFLLLSGIGLLIGAACSLGAGHYHHPIWEALCIGAACGLGIGAFTFAMLKTYPA